MSMGAMRFPATEEGVESVGGALLREANFSILMTIGTGLNGSEGGGAGGGAGVEVGVVKNTDGVVGVASPSISLGTLEGLSFGLSETTISSGTRTDGRGLLSITF